MPPPGTPTLSVNWDRWQGIGMAAAVEEQHAALTGEVLTGGLEPAEGFEVLRRSLASGLSQVVVSTADLPLLLSRLRALDTSEALDQLAARPARPLHDRPNLATAHTPPADDFERRIAGLWEEVFAIEGLGIHDDFFELGGDSLVAIQLASRLGRAFGVELRVRDLFEAPTIAGLALKIEEAMFAAARPEEIDQVLDEMQVSHE